MGISLWLVPNESDAKAIQMITHLKPDTDKSLSPRSYPEFYPHITLASLPLTLADLDGVQEAVPRRNSPLFCSFRSVTTGDVYYRSVYVEIKATDEIMHLHRTVHASLKVEPETPAFPHMSMVYIDDDDAGKGERRKYFDLLKQAGRFQDKDDGIALRCEYGTECERLLDGFEAREVWAVRCEGPVEGWEVLAKYDLIEK